MNTCETPDQRWKACREPVCRTGYDWLRYKPCDIWGDLGEMMGDTRPCSSPKRNQCRARGPQQMKPAPWNPSHGWFLMPLPGEQ